MYTLVGLFPLLCGVYTSDSQASTVRLVFNCECLIIVNCEAFFSMHLLQSQNALLLYNNYVHVQTLHIRNNLERSAHKNAETQF